MLISNKFWMRGGVGRVGTGESVGGEARGLSWRGRIIMDGGGGGRVGSQGGS